MYTKFFGLREKPFALVPDPRYLYLGSSHREALAHLMYGIEEGEGFIQIVGQVGTGKTTLCRTLVDRIGTDVDLAFIFNPSASEVELLAAINREFGLPTAVRTRSELIDELNQYLLERKAAGRKVLLVIDEAQNLDPDVLEQVRLLSNLETEREKLLQIVLLGQPELEETLSRPGLRQLRQRITVRWTLQPFDARETAAYVEHRLRVAEAAQPELFSPRAMRAVYRQSGGIPRVINAIADRALLVAFSAGKRRVTAGMVRGAARELPSSDLPKHMGPLGIGASAAVGLVAAGVVLGVGLVAWRGLADMEVSLPAVEAALPERTSAPVPQVTLAVAETSEPAAAPEPEVDAGFEVVLLTHDAGATAASALDSLLDVWGYPPLGVTRLSPNRYASAVREVSPLRVFAMHATRERVSSMDMPVILELEPQPDELRYAALTSLDASGAARLLTSGREYLVSAPELDRIWTGRAFYLWSNFESLPALSPGMSGTAVRWLQARLTDLAYLERGDASGEFDPRTSDALRRFQGEHRLEATGELGPETLIALYQQLRYGAPRLAPPAGVS